MKIYCPKCSWAPQASSKWSCAQCNTTWNTFDTQGQCPGCGHVWQDTQCPACGQWSKHHDWYHDLPPVDAAVLEATETAPEAD